MLSPFAVGVVRHHASGRRAWREASRSAGRWTRSEYRARMSLAAGDAPAQIGISAKRTWCNG